MASAPEQGGVSGGAEAHGDIDLSPDDMTRGPAQPAAKEMPGDVELIGYLGERVGAGSHIRFYSGAQPETYCDIPVEAIIGRDRIEREDGISASKVLVKPDVKLRVAQMVEVEMEAAFLKGTLTWSLPLGTAPVNRGRGGPYQDEKCPRSGPCCHEQNL